MNEKKLEGETWQTGIDAAIDQTRSPVHNILHDLAQEALLEKRRSRRWGIFFKLIFLGLLLAALGAWLMASSLLSPALGKHTAIVDLSGIIAEDASINAEDTIEALQDALADSRTAGVILRINSPGGSPVQSGIVFDEILRLRAENPDIPIYAVVSDICASGGYYIAAAADKVFADKASIIGSIGVRMDSFGFIGALDKLGIERRLLVAGENKAMLDPFLPEDEGQKKHVQGLLDDVHQQFIAAVKQGRGERLKGGDELFSGLFWSGEQALELGLIDQLANEREVARDVIGAEERVNFTRQEGLAERILGRVGVWLNLVMANLFSASLS